MNRKTSILFWCGGTGLFNFLPSILVGTNYSNDIRQIFPTYSSAKRTVPSNSAYAKIKARRAALKNAMARPPLQTLHGGQANA